MPPALPMPAAHLSSPFLPGTYRPKPLWSSWAGPRNPSILFLGEAWGQSESLMNSPFCGSAGKELWRLLGEVWDEISPEEHSRVSSLFRYDLAWVNARANWLSEAGIAFSCVFPFQLPDNNLDSLAYPPKSSVPMSYPFPRHGRNYIREEFLPEVSRTQEEISLAKPNLVVLLGNTACWATLGVTNIGSIRGTISQAGLPGGLQKVLPTHHPASILRDWSQREITVADFMKAKRESKSPHLNLPKREVLVDPTMEEILAGAARVRQEAQSGSGVISADIETAQQQITCISFAGSPNFAMTIPFWHPSCSPKSYWPTVALEVQAWEVVKSLLTGPEAILGQNFIYDLQYLARMGILPTNCTQDTMLLHHSMFPEMQKGLGFLGSIYSNEVSWKLMRKKKADTVKRDE